MPGSSTVASPFIVAEILETAAEFICINMLARLLPLPPAPGLLSRVPREGEVSEETFGGREDTQSCTSRLTLGLEMRLRVFFEEGLDVMIIVGPEGSWVDVGGRECGGRYV